ncbi:MAG: response regulator [Polyangiales bacterium]
MDREVEGEQGGAGVERALRALVIDDSEDDAYLVVRELRRSGYEVTHERVDTPEALRAAVARGGWDVVLGDYHMPAMSGMEALAEVRARDAHTPFIFVSGTMGEEAAVEALRSGAQDCVMKGNLRRLPVVVERETREARHSRERWRAEGRMSNLLDIAGDAIVALDASRRVVVFNRRAEALFGYTAVEAQALRAEDLLPEGLWPGESQGAAAPSAAWLREPCEVRCLRKGGGSFPAEVSVARLDEGASSLFTVVVRDITERKRAEAASRDLNASLDARVRERTAALESSNHALEEAKAVAEKASAAKNEFLSRMSHELRTPLNAVLGFAQLLEMDDLSDPQREAVDDILRAGRHLLDLINEVLDLTRIESGNLSVSLEPVSLGEVADEVVALVSPLAVARSARVTNAILPEAAPALHADRQRLRQVLLNLLANALKYGRAGGSVALSAAPVDDGRWRVSVTDDGPGIDPAAAGRLFAPFERLGAERTGVEGTGLGLALSRKLTELMGGVIGYAPRAAVGSEFWVELPAAECAVAARELAPRPRPSSAAPPTRRRAVLYIEDNLPNFKLVERALSWLPEVELIEAMQGQVGLDLARARTPDLVLLDLHLPDLPGAEVLARLKADPSLASVPVVVLSADATPRKVEALLAAGATGYLTKPLDLRLFLAAVRGALGISATAAGPGAAP